jgi:hypothetical protein
MTWAKEDLGPSYLTVCKHETLRDKSWLKTTSNISCFLYEKEIKVVTHFRTTHNFKSSLEEESVLFGEEE